MLLRGISMRQSAEVLPEMASTGGMSSNLVAVNPAAISVQKYRLEMPHPVRDS